MRLNSLALRLFFSATTWTVVILVITGVVLSSIYRTGVERAFDRRLGVYLRSLVADVATPEENAGKFPQSLGEPLFDLPLSGWYWQVTRLDVPTRDVRSSRSLWDASLPQLGDAGAASASGGTREGYAEGPEGQRLRIVEQTIDLGEEGRYLVAVAGDPAEIDEEIHAFDSALVLTFGVLAIVLLLTTTFQVRFGLAPLKRISEGLAAIRSGGAERLEGAFPVEIAPLARETNALIEATTHGADPLALKVREQTEIMRDQVTRHLERARLAARVAAIGTVTEVGPALSALARTMEKIHHHRGIAVDVNAPENIRFRGEQQDLEEMVGNLVDNAFKWAQSRVIIETISQARDARNDHRTIRIVVDDDGPGLSPQEREQVARRGRRLDETKPGSGLGLSIVVELASLYGGGLTLGTAPIGGLRAELMLPGV
jgi:signal transduction histidine kinase